VAGVGGTSQFDMLDRVPVGAIALDEQLRVVFWNRTIEDWTGISRSVAVGNALEARFPAFKAPGLRQRLLQVIETGATAVLSAQLHPSLFSIDGSLTPPISVSTLVTPVPVGGENVWPLALMTLQNVSELRRQIEAQKRQRDLARSNEAITAALFDYAPDGILTMDAAGIVKSFNRAAAEMFATTTADVVGQSFRTLVPSAWNEQTSSAAPAQALVGSGRDIDACRKDGSIFPIRLSVSRVELPDASNVFVAVFHDLTSEKQLEGDLRSAREEALGAARQKSEFLATMSHEIRTPLNGVLGVLQLLAADGLSPEKTGLVNTGRQCAESLLAIIDDILDLSKLDAADVVLSEDVVDPLALVKMASGILMPRLDEKNLTLSHEIDEDVPAAIFGDLRRLRQVVWNLVSNAVKFTEHGGITTKISLTKSPPESGEPDFIKISVSDTGIGFPNASRARLFQVFSQIDASATRRHGGTGLGLVICKRFVVAMGGQIDCESEPGKGSTFWFTLPCRVADACPLVAPALSSTRPLKHQLRVLLAEDNRVNQMVALKMLQRLGAVVDVAGTGRAAIDLVAKQPYDIVLMDVHMPEMDGLEATAIIRELPSQMNLPIIALTASVLPEEQKRCADSGMNDFLAKPLDLAALEQTLRKWT
jgi:PAS domain S-box-containing protein